METNLVTIGYGGKKPNDFFLELEELAPDYIVDVREKPQRAYLGCYTKAHFEKKFHDQYIWIKELGNKTRSLPPILVNEEAGMKKLQDLCQDEKTIVLLCAEKDEKRCHRLYVKEKMIDILNHQD
jgi:uncharacterized protein (DUF488 family)